MDFLISSAHAQAAAPQQADPLTGLLPLIILFVVFYFFLIRPQTKRAKEHRKMISELAKGDEIATNGGVLGTIVDIGENYILIEIADGVQVKIQRHAVAAVLPKGSRKAL